MRYASWTGLAGLLLLFAVLSFFHFTSGYGLNVPGNVLSLRAGVFVLEIAVAGILALSGMILQTLLENPLAEPYVLGVSGGASLGAVIPVFLALSPLFVYRTLFALAGSAGLAAAIFLISRRSSRFSLGTALLSGIAFNAFFSGLIVLIQSLLMPNDFQAAVRWLMGNLDFLSVPELLLVAAALALPVVYLAVSGRELDIFRSGEEMAQAAGVDTDRLKKAGFVVVSLSTGVAVSLTGMIGFLGLIVPHIVKMLFGHGHRKNILPLVLVSSTLLVGAGVLSRLIVPGSLFPVGVITSLLGAPFFVAILLKKYTS
jgi:iron complex transport system permease protein